MKAALCIILVTALAVLAAASATSPPPSDATDDFVQDIMNIMRVSKVTVTKEQQAALATVHPLLLTIADIRDWPCTFFWQAVRQSTEEIPWANAKELILAGKVVFVKQAHSLDIHLVDRQGRSYTTKEPEIDAVIHAAREVDPKGVFVLIVTE